MPKIELEDVDLGNTAKTASFYANSASSLHHGRVSAERDLRSMPPAVKTYRLEDSSDPLVAKQKSNNSTPSTTRVFETGKRPKIRQNPAQLVQEAKKKEQVQTKTSTPQVQVSHPHLKPPIRIDHNKARIQISQPSIKNQAPQPQRRPVNNFASKSAERVAAMNAAIKQRQLEQQTARLKSASPARTRYDSQTGLTYSENYRPPRQEKPQPLGQKSPYFLDSVDVDKRPLHARNTIKQSARPKDEKNDDSSVKNDRFIAKDVDKKPLGKIVKKVTKKTSPAPKPERKIVRANSYDTKVIQPDHDSKIPMALLILGTIILGAIVGFLLFLTFF